MSKQQPLEELLPGMIEQYRIADENMKQAKKIKDPLNEEIKSLMRQADVDEFVSGDYKAVYGTQERTTVLEEQIMNRLREMGREDLIIQVEKPDMVKLERLMYDNKFDPAELEGCFPVKVVETLSIKKIKKPRSAK